MLRPAALLALFWNRRVEDDGSTARSRRSSTRYRGDAPAHRSGAWRAAFEHATPFEPLEERVFANAQELDADGLEARVGSISFIAALDASGAGVGAGAGAGDWRGRATVRVPYRTEVQTWRRLAVRASAR